MQVNFTPFSTLDMTDGFPIHFPAGILGFEAVKGYAISAYEQDVPFKRLQARDAQLAFIVADPFDFLPDYRVDISAQDLQELAVDAPQHLSLFVLVTVVQETPISMTVNLQGPILFNSQNGYAKQLVLVNSLYHTRHSLVDMLQPSVP